MMESCVFCSATIASGGGRLNGHIRKHINECVYFCGICQKEFKFRHLVKDHAVCHRADRQFLCKSCPRIYKTTRALQKHIRFKHNGEAPKHKCEFCNKLFEEKCTRDVHMTTHTGEKPFKCYICVKAFSSKAGLSNHNKLFHMQRRLHKCDVCDATLSSKSHLKRHKEIHQAKRNRKTFKCSLCAKTFYDKSKLRLHFSFHLGEKSFKCLHCSSSFVTSTLLKCHTRRMHEGKLLDCVFCGKLFGASGELNIHVKKHINERSHICNKCQKEYTSSSSLKLHAETHGPTKKIQRPFHCDACGKTFRQRSVLKLHTQYVHTKEMKYNCLMCPIGYPTIEKIEDHIRGHVKERPYECDLCKKCFNSKKSLVAHQKIHNK